MHFTTNWPIARLSQSDQQFPTELGPPGPPLRIPLDHPCSHIHLDYITSPFSHFSITDNSGFTSHFANPAHIFVAPAHVRIPSAKFRLAAAQRCARGQALRITRPVCGGLGRQLWRRGIGRRRPSQRGRGRG